MNPIAIQSHLQRSCTTCKYCERHSNYWATFSICDNPDYYVEDPNYVTGEMFVIRPHCRDARESADLCSAEGRGWQQGQLSTQATNLLTKFYNSLFK